jgi:O-antigen/teichoic acid export membrane protein
LLFGHSYQEAGSVLAIHIWGAVFVFLGVASGVFFTAENYTKKSLYRTMLGAATNVALNLVLIPRHGINGAAMATVLSQFAANYLYDLFDSSTRGLLLIKTKALLPISYFRK